MTISAGPPPSNNGSASKAASAEDVFAVYLAAATAVLEAQRGVAKWLRGRAAELGEPRTAGELGVAAERQIQVASRAAIDLAQAWRLLVGDHSDLERRILGLEDRRH